MKKLNLIDEIEVSKTCFMAYLSIGNSTFYKEYLKII